MKKTKQFRPTAFIVNAKMKVSLMLLLMLMLVPQGAWALGGSGTSSSPYTIASADDLVAFASKVNGGETGAYAKLTADITLTSAWTAMGTSSKIYTGTFDGQGHKISGLSLTATAANAGLFGYVNGATIKDFSLAGSVSSNSDNVGSVVGSADGATKIYNVYSSVNIKMTAAKSHIGGIAGQLLQENSKVPEIKGCTYSGEMNLGSSTDSNGGIVGYCEKEANVQIEYCFFSGSISSSGSTPRIGGILGYADDENSQNFNYIRNCYCDGTLSPSSGTYVGAIAGYPRGNVPGVITNNTYKSGMATNALGNSKTSSTSTPITISVTAGSNGTVSQSYVNPTSTTATQLQVVATPNSGYHFTKWSDNNTTANRNNVPLTDKVNLTASFGAHTYGNWITDKAATCTTSGTKHRVCTLAGCDAREDGTIAATGHGQTNGYTPTYTWSNDINAHTCSFTLKCKDCNTNVVTNKQLTGTQTAHTDATCATAGSTTYRVTGSYNVSGSKTYSENNSKTYTIAVLGHSFTSKDESDTYLAAAATCTEDARYYYKCSRCTTKGTSTWTNTGTATGHGHNKGYTPTYTWSDDIAVHTCSFTLKCLDCNANVVTNKSLTGTQTAHTDATCTTNGSTTYKVTDSYNVSGSQSYSGTDTKAYTIPALGHDMTAHDRVPATCTETGMDAYWTCSRCEGKLFKDENGSAEWSRMPVLAACHDISNNQCSKCDLKAKAVFANNTLTFYFDDIEHDGTTYSLNTGASDPDWLEKSGDISTVVFDSSFGSARPTTCYEWFYNSQWLRKITGLEYLNTEEVTNMNNMFYYCRNLRSLDLSGFNTSKVSDMAFMFNSCISLQSLDLSSFNTSITTRTNVMFAYCNALESLTIGNFDMSLVTNSNNMFFNCYKLKTLTLKSIPFLKEGTFDTWFTGDGVTVNYELDDNSVIYTGANNLPAATSVHYTRALEAYKTVTFILPFDTNVDNINGKVYELTDFDGEVLTFSEPVDGIVHAHKPYLLRETAEGNLMKAPIGSYTFDIPGWAWFDTNVGEASMSGTYITHKNLFSTEEESIYGYSHGELVRQLSKEEGAHQGATIKPFRALIRVKEPDGASNAKARLALAFGEETSGVISIDNDDLNNKPVNVYDLNGRIVRANVNPITCLQGLPKGIYIVDGQRIMKRGEAQQGVSKATDAAASPATRSAAAEQMSVDGVIYN